MAAYFDLTDLFAFRELGEAYCAHVMWIPLASLVLAYYREQLVSYVIHYAHFAIKPSDFIDDKECEESFKKHFVICSYKKEECQQTRLATLLVHGWHS
jgi:hypothetical protein